MSKAAFVLLPGAWHTPTAWEGVESKLTPHGYCIVRVALPSVGGDPPTYDFTEDVKVTKDAVTALVEQGSDVVIVSHSYSGLVAGEALKGLGKSEREAQGLKGGVIRLVFIMAWMVAEGYQQAPRGDVSWMPPFMKPDLAAGVVIFDCDSSRQIFYNDLDDETAEKWQSQLLPQSVGVYSSTTTYAAWKYIPSTFVICQNDKALPMAVAEAFIKGAKEAEPTAFDTLETCDAGHFPMLSQVEWTAQMLRRAAGENA